MSQDTENNSFAARLSAHVEPATLRAACQPEAGDLPDIAERSRLRLAAREQTRQATLERIIQLAAENFVPNDKAAPVDPSWLARFWELAQDATGEDEQTLWARLLARELATPGTVSRRTLAFLASMEPWEISGFIEYAAFAFAFESGWRFMFDAEIARRELWSYGREIDLSQHFIAIGLLAETTAVLGADARSARGLRIGYRDKVYVLPGAGAQGVAYRKFTPTGQQLADAAKTKTFFGYARNLIKVINSEYGLGFTLLEPPAQA